MEFVGKIESCFVSLSEDFGWLPVAESGESPLFSVCFIVTTAKVGATVVLCFFIGGVVAKCLSQTGPSRRESKLTACF